MLKIDHLDFFGNEGFDKLVDKLFANADIERFEDDGISHIRVRIPKRRDDVAFNASTSPTPSWRKEVRKEGRVEKPVDFPKEDPKVDRKPKSILEMVDEGDETLAEFLGRIIDKKLAERNIPPTPSKEDEDPAYDLETPSERVPEEDYEYVDDEDEGYEEPEEDYDCGDEIAPAKKDPFVFIANRLTFLVQTLHPIVFDTSLMDIEANSLTIAVNEDKTYPKLGTIDDLGFITSEINRTNAIQKEIGEYLVGTDNINIYCFPSTILDKRHDEVRMAVKFVIYPTRKLHNF